MGTLTINTTGEQDARIIKAYGAKLGLGRNATGAEVKAHIISEIIQTVKQQETIVKEQAITVTPIDPT